MKKSLYQINRIFVITTAFCLLLSCNSVKHNKELDLQSQDKGINSVNKNKNDSVKFKAIKHNAPNQSKIDSVKGQKLKTKFE